jgi:hypothetical protein
MEPTQVLKNPRKFAEISAHLNVLHKEAIWVPVILDHKWEATWAPGQGENFQLENSS